VTYPRHWPSPQKDRRPVTVPLRGPVRVAVSGPSLWVGVDEPNVGSGRRPRPSAVG